MAWLYPPGAQINLAAAFTFGAGNWSPNFFESLPANLCEVLKNWANQFAGDAYTRDVSGTGFKAWSISLEDAALNIDVLAERLHKVLSELESLEPADEAS